MAARSPAPGALLRLRLPRSVAAVLRRLDGAGHRSWLVGGMVRDLLLGRPRQADYDLATPARPEAVVALFPRAIPTGIAHGTVTVVVPGHKVEITTFRGEGAYLDGRRPSSVHFHDDLEADLARRDFTVNAMAWDPLGREFQDPFGGRRDLRRRTIRAVGRPEERFAEDGLRPVRAVRLAAQLGFALEPTTAAAIPPALPVVARVSVERLAEELSKLLGAPHAGRGLALLAATGLLDALLPELLAHGTGPRDHGLSAARAARGGVALRLAALFHGLAAAEPADSAARRARQALVRLRFPGAVAEEAAALVAVHGCLAAPGRAPPPAGGAEVRRWLSRVGRRLATGALDLAAADARAAGGRARAAEVAALRRRARAQLRSGAPLAAAELALDGQAVMDALGIPPGRAVGEALAFLLDRALVDPTLNRRRELLALLRAWWEERPR